MAREPDDWRLTNQQEYLQDAELVWKPYRRRSEAWDHDHCEFCWSKFAETAGEADGRLTEGFTTTAGHENGAGYHWVCRPCFEDFTGPLGWRVVQDT